MSWMASYIDKQFSFVNMSSAASAPYKGTNAIEPSHFKIYQIAPCRHTLFDVYIQVYAIKLEENNTDNQYISW